MEPILYYFAEHEYPGGSYSMDLLQQMLDAFEQQAASLDSEHFHCLQPRVLQHYQQVLSRVTGLVQTWEKGEFLRDKLQEQLYSTQRIFDVPYLAIKEVPFTEWALCIGAGLRVLEDALIAYIAQKPKL